MQSGPYLWAGASEVGWNGVGWDGVRWGWRGQWGGEMCPPSHNPPPFPPRPWTDIFNTVTALYSVVIRPLTWLHCLIRATPFSHDGNESLKVTCHWILQASGAWETAIINLCQNLNTAWRSQIRAWPMAMVIHLYRVTFSVLARPSV